MRIGELSRRTGVSTRALRYYEELQLLVSARSDGDQRLYDEEAVGHVALIRRMLAAGLSGRTIAEMMPCVHSGVATPEMVVKLRSTQALIDAQIAELELARERLREIVQVTQSHVPQ